MFGVCPCGSKRVGVLLIRGRVKGRCFYRPLPVRWAYEDEIEKGPTVPGVRPADEEERQDGRRHATLEVRGLLSGDHGARPDRRHDADLAGLPRLAAFRQDAG
mgnify:CR=1 FL=1